ncbi:MAG: hypothetical protein ACI9CF_001343 [Candidatus Omnitrophota bacterium]|jgi:hypothetical protein
MAQKVKGLDVGTMNLVGAKLDDKGKTILTKVRHTFLEVDCNSFTLNMLKQQKINYAQLGKKVYVLGDSAYDLANIMNKVVQRPMQDGVISPGEKDALPIFGLLLKAVLGEPECENQLVYYSVPADPVDAEFNIVYHSDVIKSTLKGLGYRGEPMNEGHAVCFATLADKDFTGIGISGGGGMFNVCVSFRTIPAVSFATSRAGDWIDRNVAKVLGIKQNRATQIKEKGIDISAPVGREQEAVVIYYRNLIKYTLDKIIEKFATAESVPQFPDPVDIVFAGGSTMIKGFAKVFEEELKKTEMPIEIDKVRAADDPLYATAKGCLLAAISGQEDGEGEEEGSEAVEESVDANEGAEATSKE